MNKQVVARTERSEIVLTSFGFYGQCTHGCPWVGEFTPSKSKARMDAVMHDEDPTRAAWHNKTDGEEG